MQPAKVFFTDMHTDSEISLLTKLKKLLLAAKMGDIDFQDQFVAIKLHFGEPGNLAFLRPNFASTVVDFIKERGGNPFLTDCNTLYAGRRKNALEHLESAAFNGYTPQTVGCQILIADGLRGLDEAIVPLKDTKHVKEAKIGRAIMDADVVVSLSHFKGHEATGFGGAIKNLGMGGASRAGKMEQHSSGKPIVRAKRCHGCQRCIRQCAHSAISFGKDHKASIDHTKCVGCGRCISACNYDAIESLNYNSERDLCEKMAEYALAIVKNRPCFHINIVNQVSPYCDCCNFNDVPIIPDVGMFASFDPVALDHACADACNRAPVMAGSLLDRRLHAGADHHDHFTDTSPGTDWRAALSHAEAIGVGTNRYELITV